MDSLSGRTVTIDGQEWLYFSGTSYLGIAGNAAFRELLGEGIHRYGSNFGGSRLSNLRFEIFEEAEQYLAGFTGAPAALSFSSGSLAGQLLVKYFSTVGKCFFAPGIHPALSGDKNNERLSHSEWINFMLEKAHEERGRLHFFANSLDPLHARRYTFDWLDRLPKDKAFTLVIDDSHGLGVCGTQGAGVYCRIHPSANVKLVVMSSLGKALGIPGGVVLGEHSLIDSLKNTSFFGGASPIAPAYLFAFLHAKELYRESRRKLLKNIRHFTQLTASSALFEQLEDFPVFYTTQNALAAFLERHRIIISSFPYPSPSDEPVTRVVINALHSFEDIEKLVGLVRMF